MYGVGWVLDLNFQSGGRGIRMIYTIPLKFMFHSTKSNCCKTRSERRESETGILWGEASLTGGFSCVPIED